MNDPPPMIGDHQRFLSKAGRFALALSGGLDSSLLCAVAARTPGVDFIALTADTPFTHRKDIERAKSLAAALCFRHEIVRLDLLENTAIASNPPDRCYLCKRAIFAVLLERARSLGIALLLDGTNTDDLEDDRQGLRALRGLGVQSPLAALGIRRRTVVEMAVGLGLPDPDRHNSACLATRIPHCSPVTPLLLRTIERLEIGIMSTGFSLVLVRTGGGTAMVELLPGELEAAREDYRIEEIEKLFLGEELTLSGIAVYSRPPGGDR